MGGGWSGRRQPVPAHTPSAKGGAAWECPGMGRAFSLVPAPPLHRRRRDQRRGLVPPGPAGRAAGPSAAAQDAAAARATTEAWVLHSMAPSPSARRWLGHGQSAAGRASAGGSGLWDAATRSEAKEEKKPQPIDPAAADDRAGGGSGHVRRFLSAAALACGRGSASVESAQSPCGRRAVVVSPPAPRSSHRRLRGRPTAGSAADAG